MTKTINPKNKLQEIEDGKNEIYNFWKIRGYEKVTHCLGMDISLHLKDRYILNGLSLQYLEQFENEIREKTLRLFAEKIEKIGLNVGVSQEFIWKWNEFKKQQGIE